MSSHTHPAGAIDSMPSSLSFEDYVDLVDFHLQQHNNAEIPSSGPKHSTYIFSKLFKETRKEVCMVVGSFTGIVSDDLDYYYNLRACLKKGVNFKVLFIDEPRTKSPILSLLANFPKQVVTKQSSALTKQYLEKEFMDHGMICHFATFDNDKYRFEYDTANYKSVSNFNDAIETTKYKKIFTDAWELS